MIKIGIRHNLLYPFLSIIFYFTREVISIILSSCLKFKSSLLLTLIMFIAEIIAGSIFYFNNFYFLSSKNERKRTKSGRITLIHSPSQMSRLDKRFKLYFLIFIAAYFQFISFKITTIYLIEYQNISKSLDIRLRSILPLLIGVLSLFTLRLPIVKHQIFSLTIISICLIITIISESIIVLYSNDSNNRKEYLFHLLFIFIRALIDAFVELSEKYLLEYNFINPFYIVMFEGFFGSIFISINSIKTNPFKEIKEYEGDYIGLIICLIIYFFLSGGRNIYRISTNKIYSPMARSLTDAFLDPILIFYYYYSGVEKHKNIFYFIANLILSIIVVFCVGVYNDFFVLYCCGLEHHTHYEISRRASKKENIPLLQLESTSGEDGEGIN